MRLCAPIVLSCIPVSSNVYCTISMGSACVLSWLQGSNYNLKSLHIWKQDEVLPDKNSMFSNWASAFKWLLRYYRLHSSYSCPALSLFHHIAVNSMSKMNIFRNSVDLQYQCKWQELPKEQQMICMGCGEVLWPIAQNARSGDDKCQHCKKVLMQMAFNVFIGDVNKAVMRETWVC